MLKIVVLRELNHIPTSRKCGTVAILEFWGIDNQVALDGQDLCGRVIQICSCVNHLTARLKNRGNKKRAQWPDRAKSQITSQE